jgi:VWFA-related protein
MPPHLPGRRIASSRFRRTLLASAFLLTTSPRVSSELQGQESPQFRSGVELVQLDVSVLDRDRRPLTGLTAGDFTLLENGRRRPIRTFTSVQVSAQAPSSVASRAEAAPAPPSDVVDNRRAGQDGRVVVILMDRSIPTGEPTVTARRIATTAVEALGPDDVAAVVSTSGGVPQNLTSDRARLIAAIERRDWSTGPSREQDAIREALPLIGKDDPLC